jgi:hypothetical protein
MQGQPMQRDFSFRVMSLEFRLRDFFRPPERILREAGIRNGMTVLDFGGGLFLLAGSNRRRFQFEKTETSEAVS